MNILSNKTFFLGVLCLGFVGLVQGNLFEYKSPFGLIGVSDDIQKIKKFFDKDFKQTQNEVHDFFQGCDFKEVDLNTLKKNSSCSKNLSGAVEIEKEIEGQTIKIAINYQGNGSIPQYILDIYEGSTKQTISFAYQEDLQEDLNVVGKAIINGVQAYGRNIATRNAGIVISPDACDPIVNCKTCAESVLVALQQAGIVEWNKSFEPGLLRKAWNAITSKWVTIPAGLAVLCLICGE